jgi:hypothetical protein
MGALFALLESLAIAPLPSSTRSIHQTGDEWGLNAKAKAR